VTDAESERVVPHWPGEDVALPGQRLFVRRAANDDGEAAVLVHGLGGASTNWTDLMAQLQPRLDLLAPDLPGFGHSPPPDNGDYRLGALARTLARLIEQSGRGPVHLFGNSLGGAVSVRLAAQRPDLVRTLTLVSPALPDLRPRTGTLGVPLMAVPGLGEQVWRRVAAMPPERQVQAMLELNFADASRVPAQRRAEAIEEYRRRFSLPYSGDALARASRALLSSFLEPGPEGLWRQARRVAAPTLLVYGAKDRLVRPRRAARAARTFHRARLVLLPDVGHVAQMEKPDLVARFVLRFLDDVRMGEFAEALAPAPVNG
jgi:pimeloyl-ACP methyl ester carboxylesterase